MPLVESVDGRAEDYLYSPERGWIPPAIVTYPLKALRFVDEIQFHQDDPDEIELRYTSRDAVRGAGELQDVLSGLAEIVGGMSVKVIRQDAIARGPSGKLKWIVSSLSPDSVPHGRR